jgi:hypothetical protein
MDALIRSELWSNELKDVLTDDLQAEKYVRWLDNFPDGNQLTIPSVGATLPVRDLQEDQSVAYDQLDTGEFNFTINNYVQTGTYITNKAKQDLYYSSQLIGEFVPKMRRSLGERLEQDIWKEGQPKTGNPAGYHTAANANQINGVDHRWVGSDTSNSKQIIGVKDFAKALYSLKKANVPQQNLIAIVDPSVEYYLNTLSNFTNFSYNPKWEGVVSKGIAQDMRFVVNIYGWDVYTCNRLPLCGQNQTGTSETINSVASGTNAVCNIFFSATSDLLPYVGAWRQMPKVEGEYNKDYQREEYVLTARYGLKIYRPENFITVLSDPAAVS